VIPFGRVYSLFFISLACSTIVLGSTPAGVANLPLPSDLAALLDHQPIWSTSVSVDTVVGHKDNLLLSATDREQSGLLRGSVEVFVLRLGQDSLEYSFYVQGTRTRYVSGKTVNHDATAWVLSEAGYRLSETLKLSLPITGYYYDQVFDASETELRRDVAELKVSGVIVAPMIRWAFHPAAWLETQAGGERKLYRDGFNNSTIRDLALRIGWKWGDRFRVRVAAIERQRKFDERAQYSRAGRELIGTRLNVREQEQELKFDWILDPAGRWKTSTRVALLRYADNGSGYFGHERRQVTQELEWENERWLFRVGGTAGRIDFEVQTVGVGVDLPARLADDYTAELRLERRLNSRWSAFSAYNWERRRSNDPIASYRVNEGLLGVRWSWER
jgi:hypothetical protein